MDLQATSELIQWAINGIIILLMFLASSIAIKKRNNLCLGIALIGNLSAYYFLQSPLVCMLISIVCIIWASSAKSSEQTSSNKKSNIKAGNIIGLIIGLGLVIGPLIGYLRQESSLSDPTTQGILILSAVIGAFMIINNLFKLFENEPVSTTAPSTTVQKSIKSLKETASESVDEEEQETKRQVRCRFCKKLYSAEYNGCPHCKKK